jgi:two-component system chemotaxis sensor kinase CheA
MPLSPESLQAADDIVSRLATESILAQPGRDEGLIPSFSLLGEMGETVAAEPALVAAIATVHGQVERLLDSAQPFDGPTLAALSGLIAWLPGALEAVRLGRALPARPGAEPVPGAAVAPGRATSSTPTASVDVLMEFKLEENRELLAEFHGEAIEHLQQIEAALLVLDQAPDDPEALNAIFRSFHTIKGNAGFLGLVPMQQLAHEVESLLDLARNHQLLLSPAIITEILASRDALQTLTLQVAVALEKGHVPSEIVPVNHLVVSVRALATGQPAAAPVPGTVESAPSASDPAAEVVAHAPAVPAAVAPVASDKGPASSVSATVRVGTEKLDNLMDVVGELVIVQSQLIESARTIGDASSPLQRNVSQLARITKDLQHTAMALRMIPIKPVFQKMERLARDLARSFGKKVHFTTSGEDTELDRTVVEEIGDPMVHMVRNALDHGLELPEQRLASGKPETGVVHLSAYHEGGSIVIELRDDGRGMDPERIRRKAVEKGLIAQGATLTREETLALIFAPGFSTAEQVTSVSGRGVGMDVVRRNIEKLRGTVEITSGLGTGSTFRIKLPLTMAIIDGLVVRVGTDRFILPSTSVQVALRPAREAITRVHDRGEVLELRGRIYPLHRLHRRLGIPGDAQEAWDGIVVLVEHSGRVSALLVDEMVSKQEVVIKNLGAFLGHLPGIAGGAILGDGNIALILDPTTLLQAA